MKKHQISKTCNIIKISKEEKKIKDKTWYGTSWNVEWNKETEKLSKEKKSEEHSC